jgi:hypothetical protein
MHGPNGRVQLLAALDLVHLDYDLYTDIDSMYTGIPMFDLLGKIDEKVLLELKRLKEEF